MEALPAQKQKSLHVLSSKRWYKVLVVVESSNDFALLAARNIPNVTIVDETDVTVLDVVNNDKLLFTKAALSKVEEGLQ